MIYLKNTISQERLFHFLEAASPDHTPPLASVINLQEYALKIHSRATIFEAWDNDRLCGILAGYFNAPDLVECFITFLHIDRAYRHSGIGGSLMGKAINHAAGAQFKKIALMVNADNEIAINFYKKWGFFAKSHTDSQIKMERDLI